MEATCPGSQVCGFSAWGQWTVDGAPQRPGPVPPPCPHQRHLLLGPHSVLLMAVLWHVSLPFSCSQCPGVSSGRVCSLQHSPGCSPCMFPRVRILVWWVLPCAEGHTSLSPGSCKFWRAGGAWGQLAAGPLESTGVCDQTCTLPSLFPFEPVHLLLHLSLPHGSCAELERTPSCHTSSSCVWAR